MTDKLWVTPGFGELHKEKVKHFSTESMSIPLSQDGNGMFMLKNMIKILQ